MLRRTTSILAGVFALILAVFVSPLEASATQPTPIANPPLREACGLDLALVFDLSGSIAANDFITEKNAGKGVVDALTGTPSSIGVFSFASHAPAAGNTNLGKTSVLSSGTGVKSYIDGLNKPSGNSNVFTNWEGGFQQIQASKQYDAVLFITDGNPTAYYNGSNITQGTDSGTMQTALWRGIDSANVIKGHGTRIITLGIDSKGDGGSSASGLNEANLKLISGPTAYNGSNARTADYFKSGNWSELGAALKDLASSTCQGTVTVLKNLVNHDGSPAGPGAGWTFSSSTPNVNVQGSNPVSSSGQTATNGAMNFTVNYGSGENSRSVAIAETQKPDHTLVQQSGKNATCTANGQAVSTTNSGNTGFQVAVAKNAVVSCLVINRLPAPPVSPAPVPVQQPKCVNGEATGAGFTMPADTDAIAYTSTGTPAPGGTVTVTATLKGNNSWGAMPSGWTLDTTTGKANYKVTFDKPGCRFVPSAPTVTQPVCVAGAPAGAKVVLPPDTAGIAYALVGTPTPGGTVTVTATLKNTGTSFGDLPTGWTLDTATGKAQYKVTFDKPECRFVPTVPTVTQPVCVAGAPAGAKVVLPPDTDAIAYALVGTPAPGGTVTVTATLKKSGSGFGDLPSGWTLDTATGKANYKVTFEKPECRFVPTVPTVTQPVCVAGAPSGAKVVLPPDTDRIAYALVGTPTPGGSVTVTATLKNGETRFGDLPTGWTLDTATGKANYKVTFDKPECRFVPTVPTVTQPVCVAGAPSGAKVVLPPDTDRIAYALVGTPTPGGSVTVTATLKNGETRFGDLPTGWTLDTATGKAQYKVTFDKPECRFVPTAPTVTQPVCVAGAPSGAKVVLPPDTDRIAYALVGTPAPGGSVTVTATLKNTGTGFGDLPTGWTLDEVTGKAQYKVTFEKPDCEFTPGAVQVIQPVCVAGAPGGASLVLPPNTGDVTYDMSELPGPGKTVMVSATLLDGGARFGELPDGWVLDEATGKAMYEVTFDDPDCEFTPAAVQVTQPVCVAGRPGDADVVLPPDTDDIDYEMSGTRSPGGVVKVSAELRDHGARFGDLPDGWQVDGETGKAMYRVVFDEPTCRFVPPVVEVIQPVCVAGEPSDAKVTVPADTDDIDYEMSGTPAPGATVMVSATLKNDGAAFGELPDGWVLDEASGKAMYEVVLDDPDCRTTPPPTNPPGPTPTTPGRPPAPPAAPPTYRTGTLARTGLDALTPVQWAVGFIGSGLVLVGSAAAIRRRRRWRH